MKKIKIYIVLAITIAGGCFIFLFNNKELKAENCCGRCTGSANCRVCSNCSRCAHCGAGGTCGVCASYSAPAPKYTAPKSHSSTTNNTSVSVLNSQYYVVNAKTLNIRSTPSTESKIIYTLKYNDKVKLIKVVSDKWIKIEVNGITGYVYSQYITEE